MDSSVEAWHRAVWEELADVFHEYARAQMLLRNCGFPPAKQPGWINASVFWSVVIHEVKSGAMPNGSARIVEEAAKSYPYNEVFAKAVADLHDPNSPMFAVPAVASSAAAPGPYHANAQDCAWLLSQPCGHVHPRSSRMHSAATAGSSIPLSSPPPVPQPVSSAPAMNLWIMQVITAVSIAAASYMAGAMQHEPVAPSPSIEDRRAPTSMKGPSPPHSAPSAAEAALEDEDDLPDEKAKQADESDDEEIIILEDNVRSRARRPVRQEAGSDEPAYQYTTYNCIVGPDDHDRVERGETNEKGQCSESDRRVFFPDSDQVLRLDRAAPGELVNPFGFELGDP